MTKTIESRAFDNIRFTLIELPHGVEQIQTQAFTNNFNLQGIVIPINLLLKCNVMPLINHIQRPSI